MFLDGVLLEVGVDYVETDPSAGLITLAFTTDEELQALYWATGAPMIDLGDFSLMLPTLVGVSATFGPQESDVWPPRDWHGSYYEHFHNGVDFANAIGDPVYASAAGTVRLETQSAGGR